MHSLTFRHAIAGLGRGSQNREFRYAASLAKRARTGATRLWRKDALVPVDESIVRISAALERAGNGDGYAALIAPHAQHNLTIQPSPGDRFFWWQQAPGLITTVVAWVKKQMTRQQLQPLWNQPGHHAVPRH